MTRLRAFLVHLSLSAAIVGCSFAIVFFVWYPQPYFEVVGAWYLIRILFIVDVVLGPLLTFIVFKAGKPGLRFDLTVIALVQVAALAMGPPSSIRNVPITWCSRSIDSNSCPGRTSIFRKSNTTPSGKNRG